MQNIQQPLVYNAILPDPTSRNLSRTSQSIFKIFNTSLNQEFVTENTLEHKEDTTERKYLLENKQSECDFAEDNCLEIDKNALSMTPHSTPGKKNNRKYKRSSNNSHKKFMSTAKKLLFEKFNPTQKDYFRSKFSQHKNSRVYYFIILLYVKNLFNSEEIETFAIKFIEITIKKIKKYQSQILASTDDNFKKFRTDQISDLRFSMESMELFFTTSVQASIEILYKKDKNCIVKNKNYISALEVIRSVEKEERFVKSEMVYDLKQLLVQVKEDYEKNLTWNLVQLKREKKTLSDEAQSSSEEVEIKTNLNPRIVQVIILPK